MNGVLLMIEGLLMLLPLAVALIYKESSLASFAVSSLLAFFIGLAMTRLFKPKNRNIYTKEGFIIVAVAWMLMSAVGALPFCISGEIPSFTDAFFETVSGFTTTGASILTDIGKLSQASLFWRSFTHWVGGMGVLLFIMAVIPSESGSAIHIMRAEMPGPVVGKIVPRLRQTARILYLIYIGLTLVQIALLLFGKVPLFESIIYSFGTAGTGGFGIRPDSLTGYSPYVQWVITVFMLIFGVNFNLYYLILVGKLKQALKSRELWCYLAIVGVASVAIAVNIVSLCESASEAFRLGAFQVSSIMTTTGFSTCDFNLWPTFSKTVLILLMFIGGCSGSTAGGLKLSRIMMLFKTVKRDIRRTLRPRSVGVIKMEGNRVDDETIRGVNAYFTLYFLVFAVILLLVSIEPYDFMTSFSATLTCFSNVGPGFSNVGPYSSFALFTPFTKWVLSFAMLLGRLEIYPIMFIFSPSVWRKK